MSYLVLYLLLCLYLCLVWLTWFDLSGWFTGCLWSVRGYRMFHFFFTFFFTFLMPFVARALCALSSCWSVFALYKRRGGGGDVLVPVRGRVTFWSWRRAAAAPRSCRHAGRSNKQHTRGKQGSTHGVRETVPLVTVDSLEPKDSYTTRKRN